MNCRLTESDFKLKSEEEQHQNELSALSCNLIGDCETVLPRMMANKSTSVLILIRSYVTVKLLLSHLQIHKDKHTHTYTHS